jgi:hypothetical protein
VPDKCLAPLSFAAWSPVAALSEWRWGMQILRFAQDDTPESGSTHVSFFLFPSFFFLLHVTPSCEELLLDR